MIEYQLYFFSWSKFVNGFVLEFPEFSKLPMIGSRMSLLAISRKYATSATNVKERLVIIGTGWAGFKLLSKIDTKRYDVVVVSPRNYFVFTPLLASTCVGTLEYRAVTEPIRKHAKNFTFFQSKCEQINLEKRQLTIRSALEDASYDEHIVNFDKLVICCGALTQTFGIPGVKENACFLKDIGDARKIRNRILDCFEKAKQPNVTEEQQKGFLNFVAVGGGPTGVEFSAELHDFIYEDLSKMYPELMSKVTITLIDVAPKILTNFDASLSEYAAKKFERSGIKIRTGTKVLELGKEEIKLHGGENLKYGLAVWATGLAPNPLIQSTNLPLDPAKRLITDGYLRVLDKDNKALDNVFALGDCAVVKDAPLPQTAQIANQKGLFLARTLNNTAKGKQLESQPVFSYKEIGSLAYVGDWKAIASLRIRDQKVHKAGFQAWILWRYAYFSMSVSWRNKVLIPIYWLVASIFGRNTSRFQ
ncbi:Pyridine nucleotide-disulfide oxidoreductase-like protein 2 [Rozella allomycis CSF55]|uniref:NADH:ubiquinone reductase (non-electrogenic) n=1 Tax=Rozella allomycis (strain CSF55) TaxID=988480 RepID=A0A075B2H7_ROZAC|nr:Pyridine nucleotide-disulfide oxidoreductase-like protein 2 [Rozella allomycis CSF55]|eukprot:EPZ35141.1 Pyridine nucleotide-disulfide oxidoreductase-like protein 2 [Rozella allomycis CSF55]